MHNLKGKSRDDLLDLHTCGQDRSSKNQWNERRQAVAELARITCSEKNGPHSHDIVEMFTSHNGLTCCWPHVLLASRAAGLTCCWPHVLLPPAGGQIGQGYTERQHTNKHLVIVI